jgi:DNA-binding CsgD family transcriptional regulator
LARSLEAGAVYDPGPLAPALLPLGRALTRAGIIPDRDFARTAFYNECIRPLQGFHSVQIRQASATSPFVFVVCRPQGPGDFDAGETAILEMLTPHLATALDLHGRLQAANNRRLALEQGLDQLDSGVIFTDASARPVFVNQRALDIAAQSDGLILGPIGLSGSTPQVTRQLRAAIASVSSEEGSHRRQLRLERPSRRPPLLLTLLPIWRLGLSPGVATARVTIFIKEPDLPVLIDGAAVAEVFRLTARESEIATLLASGLDLTEIAATLAINRATAKVYLKRIFDKAGVHSQAKLVGLLRGFNRSLN